MFETSRLKIRSYMPGDEAFIHALFNEYNVLINLTEADVLPNLASYRKRLDAMLACQLFVILEEKETKKAIGFALLQAGPAARDRDGSVGIGITEGCWGKGYGKETMIWLINYAFISLGNRRVSLYVFGSNSRAISLYTRLFVIVLLFVRRY